MRYPPAHPAEPHGSSPVDTGDPILPARTHAKGSLHGEAEILAGRGSTEDGENIFSQHGERRVVRDVGGDVARSINLELCRSIVELRELLDLSGGIPETGEGSDRGRHHHRENGPLGDVLHSREDLLSEEKSLAVAPQKPAGIRELNHVSSSIINDTDDEREDGVCFRIFPELDSTLKLLISTLTINGGEKASRAIDYLSRTPRAPMIIEGSSIGGGIENGPANTETGVIPEVCHGNDEIPGRQEGEHESFNILPQRGPYTRQGQSITSAMLSAAASKGRECAAKSGREQRSLRAQTTELHR